MYWEYLEDGFDLVVAVVVEHDDDARGVIGSESY